MKQLLTLIFCLSATFTFAQDNLAQESISGIFNRTHDQLGSLADAFTEEQYDWRPADGVRSVGEAFLHVAQANYFIMMNLGFELPEGVDMMTMGSIEGKDNIIEALNQSFDYAKDAFGKVETETLSDEIELPFGKFSKLSAMLIVLEHSGEHKGQLIAYARSNGITPPWSE